MQKGLRRLFTVAILVLSVFILSTAALADANADFKVIEVGYDNGILKAIGTFTNTGDKIIEKVTKVNIGIYLFNDDGDSKQVADHVFTDLDLHLAPGEQMDYVLEFPDVAEYTDATKWSAEEGDWEFTYIENSPDPAVTEAAPEAEAAPAAPAADAETSDAKLDFNIVSVGYEDGALKAVGTFTNIGGKNIEKADKVNVKITLYNEPGDSKQVGNHDFTNLTLHLAPGEAIDYTLEFSDVEEYTDATKWSAEVGDWEFTYFE